MIPDIWCNKCGKLVDRWERLERWESPLDDHYVFIVECHGARDKCKIPYSTNLRDVVKAEAFLMPEVGQTKLIGRNGERSL